jgi:hypothetical protein
MHPGARAPADQPVRFSLAGPSRPYDPARQAIRPDLADVAEAEHHFAPHYAEAVIWQAVCDAPLREQVGSDLVRDVLKAGDAFALLDLTGGWAWGYRLSDHLVGYVEASALAPSG